jgi:hypothetical protein
MLKKLINKKYFSVNEKHFAVKKNLTWLSGKVFFLFWTENTF